MKYCFATAMFFLCSLASQPAFAYWKEFPDAQVRNVVQWQADSPVYFRPSTSDVYCYVPAIEKNMIALILSLHASQRTALIHCHSTSDLSYKGFTGYRLHRIIAH